MKPPTDAEIYAAWTANGPALDALAFAFGVTMLDVLQAIERQVEAHSELLTVINETIEYMAAHADASDPAAMELLARLAIVAKKAEGSELS